MHQKKAFTLIELLIPRQASSTKLGTSRDTSFDPARDKSSQGFTLIELLLVIAVIAILSVVVVLSLNPAELLRRSRDSNRVSDLDTLTHAISLYQTDQGTSGTSGFMGTSSIIYVSLPDASSTCGSWNLPTSPTGYTYQCSSPPTYRSITGTGWLPLNFQTITTGNPLGQLPIDPTNASSTGLYYTYTTNGSQFEITSLFESNQYKAQYAQNPSIPNYPEVNARGSSLTINPLWSTNGLVGYWNLDEGTGTTALDLSGNGNGGTLVNGPTWVSGKIGNGLSFNGTNNYVNITNSTNFNFGTGNFTVSFWASSNVYKTMSGIISKGLYWNSGLGWTITDVSSPTYIFFNTYDGTTQKYIQSSLSIYPWTYITAIKRDGNIEFWVNGTMMSTNSAPSNTLDNSSSLTIGSGPSGYWNGLIDDVRIYNRSLSVAETQSLYNAEK